MKIKRIEKDIESGNLGKARERYRTLIYNYPYDLDLRNGLAEIYFKIQQPAMAGRYWYLKEDKTKEMEWACKKFEKHCHHNPYKILAQIKVNGEIKDLNSEFVKKTFRDLEQKCKAYSKAHNRRGIGCIPIIIIIVVLIIVCALFGIFGGK